MSDQYINDIKDGHRVVSAKWQPEHDHPRNWTTCRVIMTNGNTYNLRRQFVADNGLQWEGI